ncbi:MAG: hypothetical protein WCS30_11990 [Selenomonadaceae bacterium]
MNALIAQVKDGTKKGETMSSKYESLPKWIHGQSNTTPPPTLKDFDIKVGDYIIATTENVKGGKFKVIAVYPNIFVTEREAAENYKEAFPIIDYLTGTIKKVAK